MSSRNHRSRDQLDFLIQQALSEEVAGEEPPADVWNRIRAGLTGPDHRYSIYWSGVVAQVTLLLLVLALSSTLLGQERLIRQTPAPFVTSQPAVSTTPPDSEVQTSSESAAVSPRAAYDYTSSDADLEETGTVMDKTTLLRRMRSAHRRRLTEENTDQQVTQESESIPIEASPDPSSLQAKVMLIKSLRGNQSAKSENEPPSQDAGPEPSVWQ